MASLAQTLAFSRGKEISLPQIDPIVESLNEKQKKVEEQINGLIEELSSLRPFDDGKQGISELEEASKALKELKVELLKDLEEKSTELEEQEKQKSQALKALQEYKRLIEKYMGQEEELMMLGEKICTFIGEKK